MKPRFLPKFPIWTEEWLSSSRVMAMTAAQEGGFIRLCLIQWREGSIPGSTAALLRLARLEGDELEHSILFEAFPLGADGQRRNEKVAAVRVEAEAYCDLQAAKGRASGEARRAQSNRGSTTVPSGSNRTRTESNPPTPTPIPKSSPSEKRESPRGKPRLPIADELRGTPLDRPDFLEAMESWESSHGRYKAAGLRAQLHRLGAWGPDRAAAAIRYSLAQGFQGIYEDKGMNGHQPGIPFESPAHAALRRLREK